MLCYVMLCYVMLCYVMCYVVNWNVTLLLTLGPFLPHDRSYSRQFLLTASCEPLIRRVKVLELVSWGNTRSVPISHCQFVPFPTSNWTENEIPGRWLLHAAPKSQVRVVVMVGVCHVPKCHHKPTLHNAQCTQVMHSGGKSNKCNKCDDVYSCAGNLRTNLKTHSGEKLNQCNQNHKPTHCTMHTSKYTVEESQTNATNVTMYTLVQAI